MRRLLFRLISLLIPVIVFCLLPHPAHAELGCYECHGTKSPPDYRPLDDASRNPVTGGFSGNHRTHMGPAVKAGSCDACHAGSHGTPSTYAPDHSDGKIALAENINGSSHPAGGRYDKGGSNPVFFNQTTVPVPGSCSNVNCHFETQTPEWGSQPFTAPADCGKCHSANPTTGSHPGTGGKHAGFACASCHPGAAATFGHATSGRLRVEFSPVPGGTYTGNLSKYLPSQSAGKTYGECRNIYCHSDGTGRASGVIGTSGNLFGHYTTPVWGGGLSTDCSSCHDYPPEYGQAYWVKSPDPQWAAWAGQKANLHGIRWHYDEPCSSCHYATTTDGTTITNPSRHANGAYDVVPGADIGFGYSYDPAGGTCSTVYCHGHYAHPHSEETWGEGPYHMMLPYPQKTACRTYSFTADESELYMQTNWHWPDVPPVNVTWDFGDGSKAAGSFAVSHRYEQPGNYVVKFEARDKIQHRTYDTIYFTVDNANIKPVTNVASAVDGMTVTLTDLSRDPDYNDCGNSGTGTVSIDWNDGTAPFSQAIPLTGSPSGTTYQHTYQNPGTYNISYFIRDNAGDYQYPSLPRLTVQVPAGTTIPLSTFKGHVTDHVTGLGLPGVTVLVKNPLVIPSTVGTAVTDEAGYYEFTNLPLDITYSIEVSKEGYRFTPASKSAWISSANAGQVAINDFHTSVPDTEPKIIIGGRIADADGTPFMAYVSLLKGDVVVKTTSSDRFTGVYSFGEVDDDCYTVKAAYDTADVFGLETREVCFTDTTVDFTHSTRALITGISGTIDDDTGEGIPNVTVNLKDADGKVVAASGTGTGSSYSFSNRAAEGCYTLQPQKYGYTFVPPFRDICGTGGETIIDQNFAGQPTAPLISIAGRITAENNGSLYYPAIYLKKDGRRIYQSPSKASAGGYYDYTFEKVPTGCYTVEPADERYVFTPTSREVCDTTSSLDFTSAPRPTMNLGGEIYNAEGIPVRYPITVNIRDSWGNLLASPVTSVTIEDYHYLGRYMATIRQDCVTIEPVAGTFTFTPPVKAVCQSTLDADFKAQDTRFRIKGRVIDQAGNGQENVTLYLQDGAGNVIRSQQTISGGYYSFGKLANACYTVVPAAGAYPYSPVSQQVCGENTNANFTSITTGSGTVATPLNSTGINVTWTDSGDESGYTVQRCAGSAECTDFADIATLDQNITQYADVSVCSETTYAYRIKSFKSGVWERLSNVASASTPAAAAPADLAVAAQAESRAMLTWSYSGSDLSGFRIERCSGAGCSDFAQIASVGPATRTFFDSGFAPGSHTYRVRAYKEAGCSWNSEYSDSATIDTGIPAITGFAVSTVDSTTVAASFADNSFSATGYILERCVGAGCSTFTPIATLAKDPAALLILNMDEPAWSGVQSEVMDSSGNNRHGTAVNGATTVEGGKSGRAGSFAGTNGYVVAGADGTALSQWSVEFWVKPESPNTTKTIFHWGDSPDPATSNPFLRLIRTSSSTVEWNYTRYSGGSSPYTGPAYTSVTVPDNQWTHLVLTYDGTFVRSYANGALVNYWPPLNLILNEKALYAIFGAGKAYAAGATYFKGLIDGAAIYRRALTAADVAARYRRGIDLSVCSASTYTYRVKAVNAGLANAGGGCWSKRAPLAITGFRPNFQTRVVVPYAAAMQADFDDIRFFDAGAGRELPFWLESKTDGVTATFWVRTGESADIHVYYGNPNATAAGNGAATFEKFDDFSTPIGNTSDERQKWNSTIWYMDGYSSITAANGAATFSYYAGYSDRLQTGINLNTDFHAQVKLNNYTVTDRTLAGIAAYDTSTAYTLGRYRNDGTTTNGFRMQKLDGSHLAVTADTSLPTYLAMRKTGTTYSLLLSHDNVNWTPLGDPFSDITPTYIVLGNVMTPGGTTSSFTMDDFLVRKYVAGEPVAAVGTEEALAACSTLGWENPYGEPQEVTTPTPGVPSSLSLAAYDTEINLSWTKNTTDETGFKIERCQGAGCSTFTQIGTVAAGVTAYKDTGLVLGASYTYRVKGYKTASCSWETGYSETVSATTAVLAPDLTTTAAGTTQVNLSWIDNTRSETGFAIERCQGAACSDFSPVATIFGTSYADSSVCAGTSYTYQVRAISAGFSRSGGGCWQWRVPISISNFVPDLPTRVSLSANPAIRTDYGDVRFLDATTGQELPYWLEGVGGYNTYAWVRTGQNNTIYMYFGNPSATSASNGKAVFEIYDEFDDGSIDPNLWTLLPGNGTIAESGNTLNFSYTGSGANDWSAANGRQTAALKLNSLPAFDYMAVMKLNSYTASAYTHAGIGVYGSDSSAYLWGRYSGPSNDYGLTRLDGTLIGAYTSQALPQLFAVKKTGDSYSFYYGSDNWYLQQKGNIYNDVPLNGIVLFGKEWSTNSLSFGVEYFMVRKIAATTPTVNYDLNSKVQATICGATWSGPYSAASTISTPDPAPPAALTATVVAPARINLAWTDASDETGFRIERCDTGGCSDFTEIATVGAGVNTYSDAAVAGGATYSYRVRGYKATGSCSWQSGYSNTATATAQVVPPAGLVATVVSDTQINLSWSDTTDAGTGFRIERCAGSSCTDFSQIAVVGAHTTSYPDTSVQPGTAYTYRVRGYAGTLFESNGCWTRKAPLWVSSGFLPNYQTKITVYYSPSQTPGLNPDFSDIRFFDENLKQELPYWVEKVVPSTNGAATATIWFKSGAGSYPNTQNSKIYMYFGNKNASSASSGTKTFEFFDDFGDGVIGSPWTQLVGNGTITESGGMLNFRYDGAAANDWNAAGRQGTALLMNALPATDFFAEIKLHDYPLAEGSFAGLGMYGSDTGAYFLGRSKAGNYYYTLQKNDGTQMATSSSSVIPHYLAVKKTGAQYTFWESSDNSYWAPVGGSYSDIPFNGIALFGKENGTSGVSFSMSQFYIRKAATAEPSLTVRADYPQQVLACTDAWEGPFSEATAVTP